MNLKTLLLASFLIAFAPNLLGHPADTSKTQVYIIGVNHNGSKVRKADSLLVLLRDIKPDLILSETDTLSGYFRSDYTLVRPAWWYKAAKTLKLARAMPPEDEVIYTYLKEAPTVAVYPFDMAIPNRSAYVKQLVKGEQDWVDAVQRTYAKGNIPQSLDSSYQSFIGLYTYYATALDRSYRDLNNMALTDSIRICMQQEERLSQLLADSVLALATFKEWQTRHYANWKERNEVMAQNIIRFSEKVKAKRVVVFTGLLHKYYMIDKLTAPQPREQFELREYFRN